jgi:Spy/CpxP family protein refolding chaperone
MKKWMLMMAVMATVFSVATSAFGQSAGPKNGAGLQGKGKQDKAVGQGAMRGKLQQEVLAKLNLTAEQKSQWEAVAKDMRAEMQKLRGQNQDGKQVDRKAMMEKMKGYQEKFMAILTPEQKEQYKKLMQEAVAKARKGKDGKGEGGGR